MNLTPHHIFISKVINRISSEKNWIWKFIPLKSYLKAKSKSVVALFDKMFLKNQLHNSYGDFSSFKEYDLTSKEKSQLLKWADETLNHKFDYLGSGLIQLNPINWHSDFKSGYIWPKGKFYKNYTKVNLENNADVKVPWELSRGHHLLWLGEAYLITSEEKYAKEIIDQILFWIEDNPLMHSINWTCSMDVAIRAVNWIYSVNMIINSNLVDELFIEKFIQSLYEHGFYIYNCLEKLFPYSQNHYTANIVGLLFLGQLFHKSKPGQKWFKFALNELYHEIRLQTLPSGVNFERSISYHALVTEMFLLSYLLLKKNNTIIPLDITYRIESMLDFVLHYTKPSGYVPQIGDHDDGRFLPFFKYDFTDHRYLLYFYGCIFNNQHAISLGRDHKVSAFFFNLEPNVKGNNLTNDLKCPLRSKTYLDAGFAILREKDFYLLFSNSSISKYFDSSKKVVGTHTQADALSFELAIGNDDFIIDPGTFVYTASPDKRNEFRSTSKHNTIAIDGQNQQEFPSSSVFTVKGFSEPDRLKYEKGDNGQLVSGVFVWSLPDENVVHSRFIDYQNLKSFSITDELQFKKNHKFEFNLHFAAVINPKQQSDTTFLLESPSGNILKLIISSNESMNFKIVEDTVSQSYGTLLPSTTLKLYIEAHESFTIKSQFEYQSNNDHIKLK